MDDVLGVAFGDYHTWTDWGLFQTGPAALSIPVVQTNYIEVPGRNGLLDLSTSLTGDVIYKSRDLSIPFMSLAAPEDWPDLQSRILNAIHGQYLQIVLDEDPDYYYTGRVALDYLTYDGSWQFNVMGVVYPYKIKLTETIVAQTGNGTAILRNLRMPVTPRVSATEAAVLSWSGHSVALTAGADQIIPALTLRAGTTEVRVETAGTVTFTYREGSL